MGVNKVAVTKRNTIGWRRVFGQPRTMSNSRLVGTAFTWTLAFATMYCSLFYIPAFFDHKTAFGISTAAPDMNKKSVNVLTPYQEILNQKRAYLKKGQTMEAFYRVNGKTSAQLVVYTCQSPIILEVFSCNPLIIQKIPLRKSRGHYAVRVKENGFYGYDIQLADQAADYDMIWRRRF